MYLNYVHVINFGPFDNFRINLKPNYLNIIQGVNGSGKTQLFGSLLTPLLGEKVIKIDKSNSPQESMVSISITNNDVTQINELNYNNNNFLYKFSSLNTFKTKDPFYHQKFISYYHISIPFFFDPEQTMINLSINQNEINFISQLITDDTEALNVWNDIVNNNLINYLNDDDKRFIHISRGLEQILKLIKVICIHSKNEHNPPIIIDGAFMVLSRSSQKFILSVLTSYSRTTQIILFTNPSSVIGNKFLVTHLPDDFKKSYSPISYRYQINNEYSLTPGKQTTKNNQEVQTPIIVRYVKDSVLNEEEYRYVEFKEVKGENPIRSILSLVDQYVVAYLNERIKQFPGRIIWGVTDKERKVVGVNLDYKQRDELRKSITDRLSQIQPPIPLSSYQIDIKKVHDSNLNYIEDIYIVEVIIEKNNSNYLFATPKGEVYIKTDGGKQKLSHFQVQEEILFRNKRNTGFHN